MRIGSMYQTELYGVVFILDLTPRSVTFQTSDGKTIHVTI